MALLISVARWLAAVLYAFAGLFAGIGSRVRG
jgi:hypothetical protein